jgi:hypothetical protein
MVLCQLISFLKLNFLLSGVNNVGTVSAALVTYASIQTLKPDLIINAGTAGGFKVTFLCIICLLSTSMYLNFSDVFFLYLAVVLVVDSLTACAVGERGEYWRRLLSIRCCIP